MRHYNIKKLVIEYNSLNKSINIIDIDTDIAIINAAFIKRCLKHEWYIHDKIMQIRFLYKLIKIKNNYLYTCLFKINLKTNYLKLIFYEDTRNITFIFEGNVYFFMIRANLIVIYSNSIKIGILEKQDAIIKSKWNLYIDIAYNFNIVLVGIFVSLIEIDKGTFNFDTEEGNI